MPSLYRWGFPRGSMVKIPPGNAGGAGDLGLIPGLGRSPQRRPWRPTPVFLPGEPHGQRSLVGYSPWGHKESDTTEQLSRCTLQMRNLSHRRLWSLFSFTASKEGARLEDLSLSLVCGTYVVGLEGKERAEAHSTWAGCVSWKGAVRCAGWE